VEEVIQDTLVFLVGAHNYDVSPRYMPHWQMTELRDNLRYLPGALLDWATEKNYNALIEAILGKEGHKSGPDSTASADAFRSSMLLWAAKHGHPQAAKQALKTGAHVNFLDHSGETPLSLAASKGCESVVSMLLDVDGIEINSRNSMGCTPLSLAVSKGYESIVSMLLDADGIETNSRNSMGYTPLSVAAVEGYESIVSMLLSTGRVDETLLHLNARKARSFAVDYGHFGIAKLLDQYILERRYRLV
jgi:ankyrin repeat protein